MQLVDKNGLVFSADAPRLHRRYCARGDERSFAIALVLSAGFVCVEEATGWYVVRTLPSRLTALACLAVGQLLGKDAWRVRLSWFDGKWNDEILEGRTSALKRMLLLAQREHRFASNRFLSAERAVSEINLHRQHKNLLDFWRDRRGLIDLRRDDDALHRIADGKFVIALNDPNTTRIVFSAIGRGIDVYREPNWRRVSTGCAVDQQPDLGYGRWVANSYSIAMRATTPQLTCVDATVSNARSGASRRMQYQRLTLPIQFGDGRSALLSASAEDLSLNLRVEVSQESE